MAWWGQGGGTSGSFAGDASAGPPSGIAPSNPDIAALFGAVAQLAILAAQSVSALTGGGNFDAALASLMGSEDESSKVAGARGAARQELLRRDYELLSATEMAVPKSWRGVASWLLTH